MYQEKKALILSLFLSQNFIMENSLVLSIQQWSDESESCGTLHLERLDLSPQRVNEQYKKRFLPFITFALLKDVNVLEEKERIEAFN